MVKYLDKILAGIRGESCNIANILLEQKIICVRHQIYNSTYYILIPIFKEIKCLQWHLHAHATILCIAYMYFWIELIQIW